MADNSLEDDIEELGRPHVPLVSSYSTVNGPSDSPSSMENQAALHGTSPTMTSLTPLFNKSEEAEEGLLQTSPSSISSSLSSSAYTSTSTTSAAAYLSSPSSSSSPCSSCSSACNAAAPPSQPEANLDVVEATPRPSPSAQDTSLSSPLEMATPGIGLTFRSPMV